MITICALLLLGAVVGRRHSDRSRSDDDDDDSSRRSRRSHHSRHHHHAASDSPNVNWPDAKFQLNYVNNGLANASAGPVTQTNAATTTAAAQNYYFENGVSDDSSRSHYNYGTINGYCDAVAQVQAWSAFISQGNVQSVLALYDRAAVMYDLWSGVPSMSSGDQIPRYVAGLYANGTGVLDPATNPQIVVDAITSVTPGVVALWWHAVLKSANIVQALDTFVFNKDCKILVQTAHVITGNSTWPAKAAGPSSIFMSK